MADPKANPPVCGVDVVVPAGLPNGKPLPGVVEPKLNPPAWVAGLAPRFKPPVLAGWVKPPVLPGVVPKGKPPVLPGAAADVIPIEPNEKPIDKQQKDQKHQNQFIHRLIIVELRWPKGLPSGAPYSYRKEKETHE